MKSYYFFGCWFWILPYNLLLFIKRKENLKILVDFMFWIVIGARKSSWRINRMDDCHFKFFVTEIHIPIQFIISLWSNTPGTVVPPSFLLLKLYFIMKVQPLIPFAREMYSPSSQLTWVYGACSTKARPVEPSVLLLSVLFSSTLPVGLTWVTGCTKK